ncbi:MAG: UdgX family uracil-DNA binding protein [Verrucomicrobia bacterium]|nr:UdgX family uracil-DNA binding protein [Verrucomicrobiota bacterium]
MKRLDFEPTFKCWREAARAALSAELSPEAISWSDGEATQLFEPMALESKQTRYNVPKRFMEVAERVVCHRSQGRWDLLYKVLWRITHGERHLLEVFSDVDTAALYKMDKEVRRDVHKMRAFVRFRHVVQEEEAWYVAWFEPDHHIIRINAPFFVDRFAQMRWSILSADECAHWDQRHLTFTDGVRREHAPNRDEVEELWRTYYSTIFNPARVKTSAMLAEMPKKYWRNLPEARAIPELLEQAPKRVENMIKASDAKQEAEIGKAVVPAADLDLESLKKAAAGCEACPLYRNATQTVFGEGPLQADIVFVGEQPGDQEDRIGRPFVGPAGAVLDRAMMEAGVVRARCYVTNSVKHFKWELRGKRRLHQTPNARDNEACRPWLEAELRLLKPQYLVCLGSTAANAVFGRPTKVLQNRGKWMESLYSKQTLITVHPSSILRARDPEQQEKAYGDFVNDLRLLVR